eukprot:jgi/Mesen1/411/ME000100S10641
MCTSSVIKAPGDGAPLRHKLEHPFIQALFLQRSEAAVIQMEGRSELSARLNKFHQWMEENGAEFRGCQVAAAPSIEGEAGDGLGVFANEKTVMVVPLRLAICTATIVRDPHLGPLYAQLLQEGQVADERVLLMLFLLVERARGPDSFWAPYMALLPARVGTPLAYSESQLQALRGTALHAGTLGKKKALARVFENSVRPAGQQLLQGA